MVVWGANRLDDTLSLSLYDEGAGNHRVSSRVLDSNTLAADHGLIHREGMRDGEREVSADAISRPEDDKIASH